MASNTVQPAGHTKQPQLNIEEIARYPLPGLSIPTSITFRPDDQEINFLYSAEGTLSQQLYTWPITGGAYRLLLEPPGGGTTETTVSKEEALRRERQRQRSLGITRYSWSGRQNRLLIPLQGNIYGMEESGHDLQLIFAGEGRPAIDPHFSPDGNWIAFVQEGELLVVPFAGGSARQLTFGARESGKTHGLAEYAAQEEMGRSHGFWWSPDSRFIAFEEVDESHIPVYRILHQGKDETGDTAQEDHRYPFSGQANACVRLGVVRLEDGSTTWMDLGADADIYLARVGWLSAGTLWAQIENREQTELRLVIFDLSSGQQQLLLQETSEIWINLHDSFKSLKKQNGFVWASERSGYRHLYWYDGQGQLLRQLTNGDWMVDSLAGVDEEAGLVYFTAAKETPLESHLYVVPLEGGEPRRLTTEPGMHTVVLDHGFRRFVDTWSSTEHPPRIVLRDLHTGGPLAVLFEEQDPRIAQLALKSPELVTLTNRDGDLLYGAVYRPPASFGPGPYPTLVDVYGGPHAQRVANAWGMTVNMRAQYLSSQGFLVFALDNRGSARRGLEFEGKIRRQMGKYEVRDQVDGVAWLAAQGLADPENVGVYGWSYGGYMSLMCLFQAPEVFKAAAAGAPVTDWDGYDTHYTERYMGTPQNNPDGYRESSVMSHVSRSSGELLLIHGLIDENVHFRHTARLINALIRERKPYQLMLFPDERHMPRKEADRIFMEEQIRDFFKKSLT